jgi:hypothetical protein
MYVYIYILIQLFKRKRKRKRAIIFYFWNEVWLIISLFNCSFKILLFFLKKRNRKVSVLENKNIICIFSSIYTYKFYLFHH